MWQWLLFVSGNLTIWQFLLFLPCVDITIIRCSFKVVFVLWNWSSLELLHYMFHLSEYVLQSCPIRDSNIKLCRNWRHCSFYIIFTPHNLCIQLESFYLLKIKFHIFGFGRRLLEIVCPIRDKCPVCDKKINTSEFAFKWLCWCILWLSVTCLYNLVI